jgi:hypothetical protein
MNHEIHITIDTRGREESTIHAWYNFCQQHKIKPLAIELLGGSPRQPIQVMCAAPANDPNVRRNLRQAVVAAGFKVSRYKHEVSAVPAGYQPLYWETHITLDRKPTSYPHLWGLSRNLFNPSRRFWLTIRQPILCDWPVHEHFGSCCDHVKCLSSNLDHLQDLPGYQKHVLEAAVIDTNRGLDHGWL